MAKKTLPEKERERWSQVEKVIFFYRK
jgi:hypothetical protein